MKKGIVILIVVVAFYSCKKQTLDGLAFPSEKLDEYAFKAYENHELEIPDVMFDANIQQSLVSFKSVDAESGESYTIYGLYMGDTATIDTDTVIYFCHGQSRHMDYYWTRQVLWSHLGGLHNYGVFMIDYRGYGMSEGESTEQGLIDDANAGLDWLIAKGLTEERAYYYGFSLGCIPLVDMAGNRIDFVPNKLICESPLASVEYLTQNSTGINADADFVTELEFNNAENIKNVDIPYLWIHGIEDDYVAIENGEIIFSNYTGSYGQALRVDGALHADIPVVYGYEQYLNAVLTFITY